MLAKKLDRQSYLLAVVLSHGKHGSHLSPDESRGEDHVHRELADALASLYGLFHTLL
jgi:hypothetical protein